MLENHSRKSLPVESRSGNCRSHARRQDEFEFDPVIPKENIFIVQLADAPQIDMDLCIGAVTFATCGARVISP